MNLSEHHETFRIIGITAAMFLLVGLGGWYVFLSRSTSTIESVGESRGFSVGIPSFSGTRGSAIENLVQGLTPESVTETAATTSTGARAPRLWQINQTPVAGASFMSGSTTIVRFVERSSGHVFDANPETGAVTRRTNTSLGTIYEAQIGAGDILLLRTLDESGATRTLSATFGTTTEDGLRDLETKDLGPSLAIAFRDEVPLLLLEDAGGSRLIASSTDDQESLFSSALTGWRILRTSPLVLAERAGSDILGSAFRVDTQGRFKRIATERGLTIAAHPESDAFLIGEDSGKLTLSAHVTASSTRTTLPLATTADKCVWAPGRSLTAYCAVPQGDVPQNFLDAWYRGLTHTTDHWFTVQAGAGTAERLFAPEGDRELDVEYPQVDESARYILFINARDKSLWLLRIVE